MGLVRGVHHGPRCARSHVPTPSRHRRTQRFPPRTGPAQRSGPPLRQRKYPTPPVRASGDFQAAFWWAFHFLRGIYVYMCSPPAHHVLTTCSPRAHHLLTTCSPRAHHLLTTCSPPAHHLLTTCSPPDLKMAIGGLLSSHFPTVGFDVQNCSGTAHQSQRWRHGWIKVPRLSF